MVAHKLCYTIQCILEKKRKKKIFKKINPEKNTFLPNFGLVRRSSQSSQKMLVPYLRCRRCQKLVNFLIFQQMLQHNITFEMLHYRDYSVI